MLALFVLPLGCGGGGDDDGPPPVLRCPLGDASAPAELQIVHLDANLQVVDTTPGATVPLLAPPQGGWIVLLGARATNLDGCNVMITTSFRDVCGGPIVKLDRRPAQLDPTGDGWGLSSATTFGNLPICPQLSATRDLTGQPWEITVELEDLDGKTASQTMTVVPQCPADASCTCQCDHNYVLGGECPPMGVDAGVPQCADAGP